MVATDVPDLFRQIEVALPLIGPYEHVARAISHHLIGAVLRGRLVFGDIYTDTRTNLMVAIQAGGGKREIERTIRQFAQETGMRFKKPTSRHVEQLIGQVRPIKTPEGPDVHLEPGYLDEDLLVLNEAYGEVSNPAYSEFRAALCTALDPIGHNQITKKRLRDKIELSYYPRVSVTMMFQPQPISADVWFGGLPRRFLWVVAPTLNAEQKAKVMDETIHAESRPDLDETLTMDVRRFLGRTDGRHESHGHFEPDDKDGSRVMPVLFSFDSPVIREAILSGWKELVALAEDTDESLRCGGLTNTIWFDLRDHLIRFACHYCFGRHFDSAGGEKDPHYAVMRISHLDVQNALVDMQRFTTDMVQFLSRWVHAELDMTRLNKERQQLIVTLLKFGPQAEERLHTNVELLYGGRQSEDALRHELQILAVMGFVHRTADGQWEAGW